MLTSWSNTNSPRLSRDAHKYHPLGTSKMWPVALYTLALVCLTCLHAVAVDGLVSPECMDAEFGGWVCLVVGWKWMNQG